MRESNSHQKFWRLLSYHLTNPLYTIDIFGKASGNNQMLYIMYLQNHIQSTLISFLFILLVPITFWLCPRPISNSQLHALLHFHLCPIYLVVFKGSYFFRMGYLILRGASRLDAFSVYPCQTWLPGHELSSSTGTPAVRPSRSSRTKDSSSQISSARAG